MHQNNPKVQLKAHLEHEILQTKTKHDNIPEHGD